MSLLENSTAEGGEREDAPGGPSEGGEFWLKGEREHPIDKEARAGCDCTRLEERS
jgi:hypothetical protein